MWLDDGAPEPPNPSLADASELATISDLSSVDPRNVYSVEDLEQYGSFSADPSAVNATHPASPTPQSSSTTVTRPELMTGSKLTGLIASCDYVADDQPSSAREYRFRVSELAQLANGDLVLLRDHLGWTTGSIGCDGPPEINEVLSSVETVVLPDEDAPGSEPHPWEWLVALAAERGLSVTAKQLREVPYRIYLSDRVVELCS